MRYSNRLRDNYKFDAIIMDLKEFYKGEAYILRVHDNGITEDVKKYAIIGHGSPYVAALYSLCYEYELSVIELAVCPPAITTATN